MGSIDACALLADRVDAIASREQRPRALVRSVAREIAGIRGGLLGPVDLATGGRNRIRGHGFAPAYDDDTRGQARHFAGVAGATLYLGGGLAHLFLRTLGGDEPGSADDRLTRRAIEWSRLLRRGELPVAEAGAWIRSEICACA
ncbi:MULTISPECIES: hypothetical protein [unclassified Rathayibacter]|uniref:hypothetical protein n=1 Tax=unclassified Rathayibacter TaxID=2609250 RepID=UPI0007007BF9|nr:MULTISPECIES: hypothetical protein [unclassified Rathayibacter]KQQ05689.1 hypothetical protein ASF42_03755 [Rathayibacter sp. Leaf294]KQS13547.1 hypothetical protein ASG06_03765 [Rathayibacter sp. Leaf185]